jgi:hypothetical protein
MRFNLQFIPLPLSWFPFFLSKSPLNGALWHLLRNTGGTLLPYFRLLRNNRWGGCKVFRANGRSIHGRCSFAL